MKMPMPQMKKDPRSSALSDLHSMLGEAIASKIKAKKAKAGHAPAGISEKKLDPDAADEAHDQLSASGMDTDEDLKAKRKSQFGGKK